MLRTTSIDSAERIIDSRDVIGRIKYLEIQVEGSDDEDKAELAALRALEKEVEGYCPDWRHGATLIREDAFEDYARELADDLHGSALRGAQQWPFDCIDWAEAADQLAQDYTSVDFDGVAYYVR